MTLMSCKQACEIVANISGTSDVVLITMTPMKTFPDVAPNANYVSCAPLMGGAAAIGMGINIAQPDTRVWIMDGDASLLMELGTLVTVAEARPRNLVHILCDNRVQYGGTANLAIPRAGCVDFAAMAAAAGYTAVFTTKTKDEFENIVSTLPRDQGPIFIQARMEPDAAYYSGSVHQREIPDSQFTRMGDEGRRLLAMFQQRANSAH